MNRPNNLCLRPSRAHGAALLVLTLVLGTLFATLFVTSLSRRYIEARREQITNEALAQAKGGLIAWALSRQASSRPGALPCPDLHPPGDPEEGRQGSSGDATCDTNARRIGRLPWWTLGLPRLQDGAGETLWYMVASPYHDSSGAVLNSDIPGQLQVFQNGGQVQITSADNLAVAIVFSPGAPLAGQNRAPGTAQTTASNYLEQVGTPNATTTFNNASTAPATPRLEGPLASATQPLLNDRLATITQRDLMSRLEQRAASEYRALLQIYQSRTGKLPYPADPTETECYRTTGATNRNGCDQNPALCRGRPPKSARITDTLDAAIYRPAGYTAAQWQAYLIDFDWLYSNRWEQVIYYGVGTSQLASTPPNCTSTVSVDGSSANGVLITAGSARSGQIRTTAGQRSDLINYLDDTVNQTGWTGTAPAADQYTTPSATSNDRLYRLP